jgi:hypothetical protein
MLKITTNLCSLNLSPPCLNQNTTIRLTSTDVQFSVGGSKLIIENINFDGYYSINNSCAEDFCSYNPTICQKTVSSSMTATTSTQAGWEGPVGRIRQALLSSTQTAVIRAWS